MLSLNRFVDFIGKLNGKQYCSSQIRHVEEMSLTLKFPLYSQS